ncbi:MAG TPA: mycofactocin system transcriptional regulator [Microbacteriaceae bacterium]|jgi:mycofactocin system transcriptional regulator|nr:mycofactocin system transcriptional regulator [Microbacteriaceae bacterium]HQA24029.1 mycofactocin system transcriptional regulator [Rhodoglobus sp.]
MSAQVSADQRPALAPGRPVVTSHADIERAAFRLFSEHGFEGTTLEAIAREVGVGRRTLFRYFESKNDIPWGQFDSTLDHFREILAATPTDLPVADALHLGVCRFNEFDIDADPPHIERMRLVLETPALQAHSVLRYAAWRRVVAEFVAERTALAPDDALPALIAQASLSMSLAAYDAWLKDPEASLPELIANQLVLLRGFLAAE